MAASLPIRPRSGRLSATPASSPAIADRHAADFTSGVDSPSAGVVVYRTVAPDVGKASQIPPAFILQRSHASKSSVGSIKSISSAGSKIDLEFDPPVSSPLNDSNPTSPEEDDTSSCKNKRTLSRSPKSTQLPKTDDDAQQSPGSGSPIAEIEKRRKSSAKPGPIPNSPRRASRLSSTLTVPPTERQRASSAPGISPQIKPGSSKNNPICLSDDDQPSSNLGCLTSKEAKDTKISAKKGRAASTSLKALASKQRSRTSSAAGRVEGSATYIARDLDVSTMPEKMDWEPTSAALLHTRLIDNSNYLETNTQTQQRTSPTGPSSAGFKELTKRHDMPNYSLGEPDSSFSRTIDTSRSAGVSLPVQPRGVNGGPERAELVISGRPSSREKRPLEMAKDDFGLDSDTESQLNLPTDGEIAALCPEFRNPDYEGAESDQLSEVSGLSDLGDLSDLDDLGFELDTSSELSDPDDIRSNTDAASILGDVLAANEEPRYPDFRKFGNKAYNEKDIRVSLIKLIKKKIKKPKKLDKEIGDVYVYSASSCPGYSKVGLAGGNIADRIDQQNCGLGELVRVQDQNQGQFRYAGRVESLIKCELYNLRRKFPCKKCKNPTKIDGGPRVHGEWYETEPEWSLRVKDKWRRWITMPKNNPYDSDGNLTLRWVWKLARHDESKEGYDLDSILQPFTDWEDIMYRKHWFACTCKNLYAQGEQLNKAITDSALFLVVLFVFSLLVHNFGLEAGMVSFVALAFTAVIIFSG